MRGGGEVGGHANIAQFGRYPEQQIIRRGKIQLGLQLQLPRFKYLLGVNFVLASAAIQLQLEVNFRQSKFGVYWQS